jgi:hypothetical protein
MKIMRPVAERRRAIEAAMAAMEAAEEEENLGADYKEYDDEADAKDGGHNASPSKLVDGEKGSPAKDSAGDDYDLDAKAADPKRRDFEEDDDAKRAGDKKL